MLNASHAVGADIRATWVGPGQLDYEVQIVFYRDCSGVAAPASMDFCYSSTNCGYTNTIQLVMDAGTGQEISPICPTMATTCTGGSLMGVQEYTYTTNITLPQACDDWNFSTFRCCRNGAITNINTPANQRIWLNATLDNLNFPQNSTPSFQNKPVPFICVGQPFTYNHGAQDPEGDQLVYSLITPMVGTTACNSNGTITYIAPFSATQPLSSTPPMTIDPVSGDIVMNPTQQEITVMAVLVEEYKNGVKSGSVVRDIQIIVEVCNNELPTLTGMNGQPVFLDTVCAGETICFDINSADLDAAQILSMTWDQSITGGSLNVTGAQFPVGTFCWTPSINDTSSVPYYFTITIEDDNCPYFGFNTYSYGILVTAGIDTDLGGDQTIYCGDSVTLSVNSSNPGPFTYQWSTGDTISTIQGKSGPYQVTIDDGSGCFGIDSMYIDHIDKPTALFDQNAICLNDSSLFIDTSMFINNPSTWSWSFGDGGISNDSAASHVYTTSGAFNVTLIVTDDKGCIDSVTKSIFISDIPTADFIADSVCPGTLTTFIDQSTFNLINISSWSWDFGDNYGNSTLQNPLYTYTGGGSYDVILEVVDMKGCKDTISKTVLVYQEPVASSLVTSVCEGQATQFTDNSSSALSSISSWNWNFGDPGSGAQNVSTLQSPSHTYSVHGAYNVSLDITDLNGCIGNAIIAVDVFQNPLADFAGPDACLNDPFVFTDNSIAYSTGLGSWTWDFDGTGNSVSQNPTHSFPSSGAYNVELIVEDLKGCKDTIEKSINVLPLPVIDFMADLLKACAPMTVSFTDMSNDAISWDWDLGDTYNASSYTSQNPTHTYTEPGLYTITLNVTSSLGCSNSFTNNNMLEVYDNPIADFIPVPDKTSLADAIFNFNNTSFNGATWIWDFGDGETSTDEFPVHIYSDTGWHQVSLITISIDGCKDTTLNDVYVAPNFSIFFPNAFTPNGDMRNDNYGGIGQFEGIKEYDFRIFNRWGELVYNTDDPTIAWNGRKYNNTANPISQDGAYVYLAMVRDFLERKFEFKGAFILLKTQ